MGQKTTSIKNVGKNHTKWRTVFTVVKKGILLENALKTRRDCSEREAVVLGVVQLDTH